MFFRIAKYSVKNILRNKFLSLSSVLVLTLLMFFINILVILHDVSITLIDSVNSKMTISLYLKDEYSQTSVEVIDLMDEIKNVGEGVNVSYKTKDQILEEIKLKEPDLAKILERTNPLPDTINLSEIKIEEYETINNAIKSKSFILSNDGEESQAYFNYSSQYNKIKQIVSVLDILQVGLYVIIAIFILSIFVITYSIVGNFIYYYKDEIYITRLVGGSGMFIYGPFVLQGAFYSAAAFFLSMIVFISILSTVNQTFSEIYFFDFNYLIFFIEMIVFILVGGISGFLSSKKYLK